VLINTEGVELLLLLLLLLLLISGLRQYFWQRHISGSHSQFPTAEAGTRSQGSPCGICGCQSGTGSTFIKITLFLFSSLLFRNEQAHKQSKYKGIQYQRTPRIK